MAAYEHGGDIYSRLEQGRKLLDFSSNINPRGMPEEAVRVLSASATACTIYPDPCCRALVRALADYEHVAPERIICGNGAADLTFRLAYGLKPRKLLVTAPTFSEYEQAVRQAGGTVCYHLLREEADFRLDDSVLNTLEQEQPDLVFLCNPNNPTGKLIPKALLLKIAEQCQKMGAYLVVDECFLSFAEEGAALSMIGELDRYSNLVVLKAFTKFFAMAGLRLGYLLCGSEKLREAVLTAGQPWSVSTPAQLCGIAALQDSAYIERTKRELPLLREALTAELSALPVKVYRSSANYLLFRSELPDLDRRMEEQGILIRSCANYHGLGRGYYRVAVKAYEDNQKLIAAMRRVLKGE